MASANVPDGGGVGAATAAVPTASHNAAVASSAATGDGSILAMAGGGIASGAAGALAEKAYELMPVEPLRKAAYVGTFLGVKELVCLAFPALAGAITLDPTAADIFEIKQMVKELHRKVDKMLRWGYI